jgi:hypothetical protein
LMAHPSHEVGPLRSRSSEFSRRFGLCTSGGGDPQVVNSGAGGRRRRPGSRVWHDPDPTSSSRPAGAPWSRSRPASRSSARIQPGGAGTRHLSRRGPTCPARNGRVGRSGTEGWADGASVQRVRADGPSAGSAARGDRGSSARGRVTAGNGRRGRGVVRLGPCGEGCRAAPCGEPTGADQGPVLTGFRGPG